MPRTKNNVTHVNFAVRSSKPPSKRIRALTVTVNQHGFDALLDRAYRDGAKNREEALDRTDDLIREAIEKELGLEPGSVDPWKKT